MIKLIVDVYRLVIVAVLLVALVVAAAMAGTGWAGLLTALGFLVLVVLAVGISATLLSINDHLLAMRRARSLEAADAIAEPSELKTGRMVMGGIILLGLGLVLLSWLFGGQNPPLADGELAVPRGDVGRSIDDQPGRTEQKDPLCDPELARSIGNDC